jgi:hypothetical protein
LPAPWLKSARATGDPPSTLSGFARWRKISAGSASPPPALTRPHVLLHCPNAKLRAARAEAWEGKTPGGVRVLLANPRWERRLVKFLELSGVGRVMADETDKDGAYAARLDEWIA